MKNNTKTNKNYDIPRTSITEKSNMTEKIRKINNVWEENKLDWKTNWKQV